MAFSINTNIASLQAQDYLRVNQDFQQKTINRVTSGLRIVSSGDDAAGLAIANSLRSDRAVLSQGVRNANDAMSTLQTIDGGLNNISQLLDRARTLAAQSATGTFASDSDRAILDSEFQSVISEIDRQSQVIGLNSGGTFAKNLKVFIGGGRGETDAAKISNGSVAVDLSTSTVDASSLKLKGFRAEGVNVTEVNSIVTDETNLASVAVSGKTDFFFRGAGFGDDDRIRVSVNLSGVDNAEKLAEAINNAITEAGNGGSAAAAAFKNAGIKAKLVTDSDNNTTLVFESSTAAFQVAAGDRLSNALLGNQTGGVGNNIDYTVTGATAASAGTTAFGTSQANNIIVRVQGGSLSSAVDLTLDVTTSTATTVTEALTSLSSQVAANASLQAAGISVSVASGGSNVKFVSKRGEEFEVLSVNDASNRLGLGSGVSGSDTSFDITSVTMAVATAAGSRNLLVSVGGGAYQTIAVASTTTGDANAVEDINAAIAANSVLSRAGLQASSTGAGYVTLTSSNGSNFRVTGDDTLGFATDGVTTSTAQYAAESFTTSATKVAGGSSATGYLAFSSIRDGGDDQLITVTAKDASGVQQSVAINLKAENGAMRGSTIDEALDYINDQLQASDSADMRRIVAVKERDGGTEKIRFLSALPDFKVSVGSNAGSTGITTSQGDVASSSKLDGGANIDISSQANAESAVAALAQAVALLGNVQAVVGRGQNQFNFAIGLAQTQLNNLAASESRIRDADLAAEAANLTKAQLLQQAGIAALAQANSAPQAVLSLLRG